MSNSIFKMMWVLAVVLLLVGFAQAAFAWTLSGTIYGGGNPAPGATVSLTDAITSNSLGSTTTDGGGNYTYYSEYRRFVAAM